MKKLIAVFLSVLLMAAPLTVAASAIEVGFELTLIYTDASGNQQTMTYERNAGESLALPTIRIEAGQTFSGWFEDEAMQTAAPSVMPDGNLTLYAEIKWIDYVVRYVLDNEEFATQTYHYGDSLAFPALNVETGFTFSGWSDAQGKVYSEEDVVVGDLALSGTVTQNDYTLT